eukprot:UN19759
MVGWASDNVDTFSGNDLAKLLDSLVLFQFTSDKFGTVHDLNEKIAKILQNRLNDFHLTELIGVLT